MHDAATEKVLFGGKVAAWPGYVWNHLKVHLTMATSISTCRLDYENSWCEERGEKENERSKIRNLNWGLLSLQTSRAGWNGMDTHTMKYERLPKRAKIKKQGCHRKWGRPQRRWEDCPKGHLRKAEVDKCRENASNKDIWKKITTVAVKGNKRKNTYNPSQYVWFPHRLWLNVNKITA